MLYTCKKNVLREKNDPVFLQRCFVDESLCSKRSSGMLSITLLKGFIVPCTKTKSIDDYVDGMVRHYHPTESCLQTHIHTNSQIKGKLDVSLKTQ